MAAEIDKDNDSLELYEQDQTWNFRRKLLNQ